MKNKKTFWIILLAFALLLGGAYALYSRLGQNIGAEQMVVHATPTAAPEGGDAGSGAEAESEAIPAPDFTVYDQDGGEVQLSQFFGKPIVLNFWASWCGPCKSEMPDFNEKYAELGDEVNFVMVNMTDGSRETVESASAFIEENGYAFPVFYDQNAEAAIAYGARSLPTSFFINAEGHVIAQARGAISSETLQKGIDMIRDK